jgi:hypothetical protein
VGSSAKRQPFVDKASKENWDNKEDRWSRDSRCPVSKTARSASESAARKTRISSAILASVKGQ